MENTEVVNETKTQKTAKTVKTSKKTKTVKKSNKISILEKIVALGIKDEETLLNLKPQELLSDENISFEYLGFINDLQKAVRSHTLFSYIANGGDENN